MPVQNMSGNVIVADLIRDDGDWSELTDADALIAKAVNAVGRHVQDVPNGALVSIALSCDEAVASLNGAFRGMTKPTNVLSFPAGEGNPKGFLGDIILAEETIIREAKELETPLHHHVQHLVIHGVLHLLGYDHQSDADAEHMEALEIAILSDLEIANPYTGDLDLDKMD